MGCDAVATQGALKPGGPAGLSQIGVTGQSLYTPAMTSRGVQAAPSRRRGCSEGEASSNGRGGGGVSVILTPLKTQSLTRNVFFKLRNKKEV